MGILLQDVRYAFRTLMKRPALAAVIAVTLGLGIGANTAIFSVLNGVVLRPLSFDHPDDLVVVRETDRERGGRPISVSYPNFVDWRAQNHVFEDIGILRSKGFTLTGVDEPERIPGARVSAGFFSALKVKAALGRTLRADEDQPGSQRVVVVSDGLWHRRFGGDPGLVGRTLTLDGDPFTVIGILPPGFDFPVRVSGAEVWTQAFLDTRFVESRGAHGYRVVARLRPNITLEQAQAEMDTIARRLERQYPDVNAGFGVSVIPLHEQVVGQVRPAMLVLMGAVGLVLLIACANVANLLLARGAGRRSELAIRATLGAGRLRLARLLLTESVLLGLAGGAAGLLLALWAKDALVANVPADLPRVNEIGLDANVLAFTAGMSLFAGLLFGVAPALHVTRLNLSSSLKEGGRPSAGMGRHRLRSLLVICEVAMALVLLIGAGLLLRSFAGLTGVKLGFDPERVLTFRISAPGQGSTTGRQRAEFYDRTLARLEALPGVRSASAGTSLPHTDDAIGLTFQVLDHPELGEPVALYDAVSADYFHTMGIPLLKGRLLTRSDTRGRPGVLVINESFARMARQHLPDEEPIGLRLTPHGPRDADDPESFEVVGIVGDVRDSVYDEPEPHMYLPLLQQTWASATFAVRTHGDPAALVGAVRSELAAMTKAEAPYAFRTMKQHIANSVAPRRFGLLVLGVFATVALALAAVGIYGMLSNTVAQRTHEVGVRMALGAQAHDVFRLVIRQGLTLTAIGRVIGLGASVASTRVLSSQLYEIGPMDPLTFIGISILLGAVALLACYIPARRATKVDPMVALRCE
jgi:putative ABC transport system permease protein